MSKKFLTKEEEKEIFNVFSDLLHNSPRLSAPENQIIIRKAFNLAHEAHKAMRRKSGEPYIYHPLEVAMIVTQELGLGAKSVVCALLHDVVEDTEYTLDDIENLFGQKIASIIDGLTKISDVFDNQSSLQAENFRKMLLTLSDDVRVILIKLADRLHNMRTLGSMPQHKQIKIAGETIYLYAPLAHRMGLYAIKTELEDLSLKYTHPKQYEKISKALKETEKKRQGRINKFSLPIIEKLNNNRVRFNITGRPKSIYSIWKKMQTKNVSFEEIYDLLAIRIVFRPFPKISEKTQCWHIYGLITDIYMPKPERIRDWVSTPKANGYEALHGTVMGPDGEWLEVQIRSQRMDEIAERGFAAHWKYKNLNQQEGELDRWIKKVRELLENPNEDALEFLDEFKMNLFSSEIHVFTPKGDIITLPKGATALDFAYEIHTQVGNKAVGAKLNRKLVPLNYKLKGGDQIEIITSDKQRVHRQALEFVKSAKAKSSIIAAIKAETKDRIQKGKKNLEEKLSELNLQPSSQVLKKLFDGYEVISKDELYSKIGAEIISLNGIKKILKKNTKNKLIRYWELQFRTNKKKEPTKTSEENEEFDYKSPLLIREKIDESQSDYMIAKCCNPIPGDAIMGYKEPGKHIIIHKTDCPEGVRLMSNYGQYIIAAKWTTHKLMSYLATIHISGIDRLGIYNDITTIITKELDVNMRNINLYSHNGIIDGTIDLYVHNTKDLNNLIGNIIKIKGVDSVSRVVKKED